jgi:uncharacterized protein (TIGR02271 family)
MPPAADATPTGAALPANSDDQADEPHRLLLREERLHADTNRVETGGIRIRREVITEHRTIVVSVKREEIVIERVPAGHHSSQEPQVSGDTRIVTRELRRGEELRIPVREERVTVSKQTVVTEEVRVGIRTVQDTERVTDIVRHEEARVETIGDVEIHDNADLTHRSEPTPESRS